MEPNKVMIINEATWALPGGSTDRLGPGPDKVWKLIPKQGDLDGFQGNIRITDAQGDLQVYEIPGTSTFSDVNSHATTEIWMLHGDYITRWDSLAYLEIYEYSGFDQQFIPASSSDYDNFIETTPSYAAGTFKEQITLPVPYRGASTPRGNGLSHSPTEMYLAYMDDAGNEYPIGPVGTNGYLALCYLCTTYITFPATDAGHVTTIDINGMYTHEVGPDFNYGYCLDSNNVIESFYQSADTCANAGFTWSSLATNTWHMKYDAGITSSLPELRTFNIQGSAASSSTSTSGTNSLKTRLKNKGIKVKSSLPRHLRGVL